MTLNKFKTLIVDDEWLVRSELRLMLAEYEELTLVGEAANIEQAVLLVQETQPDVIFLDIQMPGASGFELLERTAVSAQIIFITAFDQYAIRAFEVNALDYLLKPISRERLQKAVVRLRTGTSKSDWQAKKVAYEDVIYVVADGSLKFIKLPLLKALTAAGNYSYILYGDKPRILVTKTLQEWEELLPDKYFVRIHRSAIINFEYVDRVVKCENYTHQIHLRGVEQPFVMSRRYAAKLRSLLSW
ncbi:response regulator transcription factor [bacterium]|nr:response regulator transcription factor [bacterium]